MTTNKEITLRIAERVVGDGAPCYVIAEAGVNHNGSLALAEQLVDAAADAGADAVKFQTFVPELLASPLAETADYQRDNDSGDRQIAMLRSLMLPPDAWKKLSDRARLRGLHFLSTPFDIPSLELLLALGLPALKVSSGDLTNLPFLKALGQAGVPVLVSTGMGTLNEVADAVETVHAAGAPLALFHCVSSYPAPAEHSNLRAIATMRAAFGVPCGWSDHTPGIEVSLAAAALGAALIEKHLTLDRSLQGPDHAASLEPSEFARLCSGVRTIESAMGTGEKRPAAPEIPIARVARRSICAARDLHVGAVVTTSDIMVVRPGTGLAPKLLDRVVGARLVRDVPAGQPLTSADVAFQ